MYSHTWLSMRGKQQKNWNYGFLPPFVLLSFEFWLFPSHILFPVVRRQKETFASQSRICLAFFSPPQPLYPYIYSIQVSCWERGLINHPDWLDFSFSSGKQKYVDEKLSPISQLSSRVSNWLLLLLLWPTSWQASYAYIAFPPGPGERNFSHYSNPGTQANICRRAGEEEALKNLRVAARVSISFRVSGAERNKVEDDDIDRDCSHESFFSICNCQSCCFWRIFSFSADGNEVKLGVLLFFFLFVFFHNCELSLRSFAMHTKQALQRVLKIFHHSHCYSLRSCGRRIARHTSAGCSVGPKGRFLAYLDKYIHFSPQILARWGKKDNLYMFRSISLPSLKKVDI